ncbi:DUF2637 domain-containing protein [Nocardia sp. CA-135398]|uniref:DUF2637 domain-containing protein n=1 Tax=Nocardia sp. CA-135398 TaxID=3239977 RepID=UPI003D97B61C
MSPSDQTTPTTASPGPTVAPCSATIADRTPRAHAFFWCTLIAAAGVSIAGNATQAVLHTVASPVVAASVAIVPPIALLFAVHGVSILLRAHAAAHATRLIATAMTVLIAAGAFWLSFTALRAMALLAGVPVSEAWLWPLIVEGSMAQSTVALLALAHSNSGTETAMHSAQQPAVEHVADLAVAVSHRAHTTEATQSTVHTIYWGCRSPERWTELAAYICDQDTAHRRDPAEVVQILALRHDSGWNISQIAREINRSRSTVSRIISQAAEIQPDRHGNNASTRSQITTH